MSLLIWLCTVPIAVFFVRFHCDLERRIFGNVLYDKLAQFTDPLIKPTRKIAKNLGIKTPFDPSAILLAAVLSLLCASIILLKPKLSLYLFFVSWLGLQECAILLSVIASWLQTPSHQPLLQIAEACQAIYMRHLRKLIPPIAGVVDVCPLIALLLIITLRNILGMSFGS